VRPFCVSLCLVTSNACACLLSCLSCLSSLCRLYFQLVVGITITSSCSYSLCLTL
jgi:hypothetical protein